MFYLIELEVKPETTPISNTAIPTLALNSCGGFQVCDDNANCNYGTCECITGYIGDGITCTGMLTFCLRRKLHWLYFAGLCAHTLFYRRRKINWLHKSWLSW